MISQSTLDCRGEAAGSANYIQRLPQRILSHRIYEFRSAVGNSLAIIIQSGKDRPDVGTGPPSAQMASQMHNRITVQQ